MKSIIKNAALIFLIGVFGCNTSCNNNNSGDVNLNEPVSQETIPKYNIIVLLDLSDRVFDDSQIAKDKKIITSIYNTFNSIAGGESKAFFNSNDKIKIKVLEQKDIPYIQNIAYWEDSMSVNYETLSFSEKGFNKRAGRTNRFLNALNSLYQSCKLESKDKYKGANILKYFKQDIISDLDTSSINKVFILTDGYPVVEGKSVRVNELEDLNDKLAPFKSNVDVYFLGIQPRDDVRDEEYHQLMIGWSNWLLKAGLKEIDESNFLKNSRSFNEVQQKINTALGTVNITAQVHSSANQNAKATFISDSISCLNEVEKLIGGDGNLDVQSSSQLNEVINNIEIACGVDKIIVQDKFKRRELDAFILAKTITSKEYYKITSSAVSNKILTIQVSKK